MTHIPSSVLQPFIEISGANTAIKMLNSHSKKENDASKDQAKAYPYNFDDVLQDKSVYIGICCRSNVRVELVRLYIRLIAPLVMLRISLAIWIT